MLSTPQPSVDKPIPTSRKLAELKVWALEFCREETKSEEVDALYEWFDAYHKRQFMPAKDALIL